MRAAVAWSLANDRSELVMRIAGSIWHYFPARGLVTEGRAWLSDALATTGPTVAPFRAKALVAAGHLAHERRDLDVAHRYFTQARMLAEAIGDTEGFDLLSSDPSRVLVIRGEADAPVVYLLDAKSPDALLLAERFPLEPRDVVFVSTAGVSRWSRVINQLAPTLRSLRDVDDVSRNR